MTHADPVIEIVRQSGGVLHVHVRGTAGFDSALAYWQAIADAVEAQPARYLLLIDELRGASIPQADWKRLVGIVGPRLGALRIAHVKPHGLDTVEHCVLAAMASGLDARAFDDARMAMLWLRYGSPDA